jgi:hypothetical protein
MLLPCMIISPLPPSTTKSVHVILAISRMTVKQVIFGTGFKIKDTISTQSVIDGLFRRKNSCGIEISLCSIKW